MPITVDAVTNDRSATGSLTITMFTIAGSDRLLLAILSSGFGADPVTSSTWNGVALTKVFSQRENSFIGMSAELWSLVAPDTGTHDFVVNWGSGGVAGLLSLNGVDQSTPLGTFARAEGNSTAPSTVVSSASGELVVDSLAIGAGITLTVGSGQTQIFQQVGFGGWIGAGSYEAGAGSVTMDWASSITDPWAIGAVPVKPAAAAGNPWYAYQQQ